MRWMMYRWWREGGVIGHGGFWDCFLHSPNKGFCACLGDLPSGMLRRPETLFFCSKADKAAPLSSGWPRVTIAKGNSIIPTCETYCQGGCFKATTTNISACTVVTLHWQCLHWYGSCIGTAVERRSQRTLLAINQWSTSGKKTLFTYPPPYPCHLLHNIMFYRHIVLFLM